MILLPESAIENEAEMRIASFDVDAQKGFTTLCPNELPVPDGECIVAMLNAISERVDLRVGSKDAHSPNAIWVVKDASQMLQKIPYANADLTWVSHCVPGSIGFELLDGLPAPVEYDYFVWKGIELDMHPYGACFHDLAEQQSTGVIEYLKSNHVDWVIVGGLALDYCVKTTALQLANAGFHVVVVLQACRALSAETANEAIVQMKRNNITICNDLVELDRVILNREAQ